MWTNMEENESQGREKLRMEKIQEDEREGWGSEVGLFDLDWWYLISTVITIPMAPRIPALISILHSGNESMGMSSPTNTWILQEREFWNIQGGD